MVSNDSRPPAGQPDRCQEGATETASEVTRVTAWAGFCGVVAIASAAIPAWDWSRKALALTWPIFGIVLGAIASELLGPRGERALSAWRAWAAWEAVPANPAKQPDLATVTTALGMFTGVTVSVALVRGWPDAVGMWAGVFCVSVLVPALGKWAGTSIIKVATIWLGFFLLNGWYWNSITYLAMPNRTRWVLGISIAYAILLTSPFLWNLRQARRRAAGDPVPQKLAGEGGPRLE